MKVLKFSGASVGSIANLQNVKRIVDEVNDSAVIVVSAVDGVTDWLFSAVEKATDGDATYVDLLQKVKEVHNQLIEGIIPVAARESLNKQMDNYFLELSNMLKGVFLLKDSTFKSTCSIVAYGELLASTMVSYYLDAKWIDSRELIKTYGIGEEVFVSEKVSFDNIKKNIKKGATRVVLAGYIASSERENYTTLLGRGGTD